MSIVFVVDSASDFSQDLFSLNHRIEVVPLNVHFGDTIFLDGVDISKEEFYSKMAQTPELPKTSQPSPQAFYEMFKKQLDDGHTILSFSITSKLSGTYQSAHIAKGMFSDEEQKNIYLIDTESLSVGVIYLVKKADELLAKGTGIEQVVEWLEEAKKKIRLFALLDTLENLKKGGRISTAQAFIGEMLSIKPIILINDGIVDNFGKFRGRKKGLKALSEKISSYQALDRSVLFVAHSFERLEEAIEELKEVVDVSLFEQVYYTKLGSTLGTHAGQDTLGVCVIEK